MKKSKLLLLLVVPLLMAHSVWIQINNTGWVGKKATAYLYFGEIRENEIMKGLKWYEGEIFKEFKAFVKPHNSTDKQELSLVASPNDVTANFTPNKAGIYQIVAYNETGTIKDYTRHGLGLLKDSLYLRTTFEAKSWRKKQEGTVNLAPMMKYDIVPFPAKSGYGDYTSHKSVWRVKEKVYATLYIDGKPAVGKEVRVYSPDGWTSIKKTNKKGEFYFLPYKTGTYQAIYQTKRKLNGTHKGKKYNTTRVKVITNLNIE